MPKIPTYEANVSPEAQLPGSNPYRVDADASSFGGGRGLEAAGAGLADAGDTLYANEQREEVSSVAAQMATLRGNLTAKFAKEAAENAGKPGFTESFMADATNQIQSYGGNLQTKAGQQAFTREAASLTSDFLGKTTTYNVAVAGAKAVTDYHTMVNQNAGTLFNDPSQASSIFKSIDSSFSDPHGPYAGVPATERAELQAKAKETLAIAAARGVVRDNPDLAEKLYNKGTLPGQDFLTEQGNAQIVSYIQSAQNAERTKKALALAQQEHAQTMAAEADGNNILRNIVKDPTNPGITDAILNSRMKWSQKETMLQIAKHAGTGEGGGGEQNHYGSGFFKVYQEIHSGQITKPDDLYKRVGPGGDLTVAGVDRLTAEITGRRTPDGKIEADLRENFVSTFKRQISGSNPMVGLRDPKGDVQTQKALAWFLPEYQKRREAGESPQELLDPANPKSLWPGVMRFKRDQNTMMKDLMNPGTATPATYRSAADVANAYKAGRLGREEAASVLRQNGWAK
jgi:hypothetical protein